MNMIFIHVCNGLQRSNLIISIFIPTNIYHFSLEGGFTNPPPMWQFLDKEYIVIISHCFTVLENSRTFSFYLTDLVISKVSFLLIPAHTGKYERWLSLPGVFHEIL